MARKRGEGVGTRHRPRPRGTGSIQTKRLSDGTTVYYAVVRNDGKPVWHRAGTSAQEAQALLNELLTKRQRGEATVGEGGTAFDKYARAWIADFKRSGRKPSTKSDYARIVERGLIPHFGNKAIEQIERHAVQDLVTRRIEGRLLAAEEADRRKEPDRAEEADRKLSPVSAKTALNEVAVLRKLLNDAAVLDSIPTKAPCRRISAEVIPRERVELSRAQVQKLLGEIPAEHKTLVRVLAYLGLRLGEALALRWDDFNDTQQTLHVGRSWTHNRIVTPKTKAGERTLRLSDAMTRELKERRGDGTRNNNVTALIFMGAKSKDRRPNPNNLIFPNSVGGYIDPGDWRTKVFHPAVAGAGLNPNTVPHSLRHSAARRMVELGWPMPKIMATLGHRTIKTTIDLYGHLRADEHPGPADTLEVF